MWSTSSATKRSPGTFQMNSGISVGCRKVTRPIEAFSSFFTDEMTELMVTCTNNYGDAYFKRRDKKWKQVTVAEIRSFFGILIAAGRNKQNQLDVREMWTATASWRVNFYRLAMSMNRFREIYICWRFDDFKTRPLRFADSKDKLEPVRDVLDMFLKQCQKNYTPDATLTVDERLCLFRGIETEKLWFILYLHISYIYVDVHSEST